MNIGFSTAAAMQFASLGVPSAAPSALNVVPNNPLSGRAMEGFVAARHLEAFFLSMLGGGAMSADSWSAGVNPYQAMQAGAMGFAGAAWMSPAFAPMGPGAMAMAPGASMALAASGQGMGMGSVGFSALFAVMGLSQMGANQAGSASLSMAARIEEDPHGVAQSGQGMKSNLANSPETMLAIQALLKEGKSKSYEDLAKDLKSEFGIDAEVGDIKIEDKDGKEISAKGVKFGNGDYFVDGNGNGQLETADYKFGDAVTSLKEKYNLKDEDLTRITDRMKAGAKQRTEWNAYLDKFKQEGSMPPALGALSGPPPLMHDPQMNMNWMMLFFQAYQLAS
jgi:hypothetical protein